jgi:hypothetical protein
LKGWIIGIYEYLGSELCSDDRVRFDKSGLPSIALPPPPKLPGKPSTVSNIVRLIDRTLLEFA